MEIRHCNVCGREWIDNKDRECPYCHSLNTIILYDENEGYEEFWNEEE